MPEIKPIPVGVEFYKGMIDDGYYYVDKTLLIRDLIAQKNTVTLFTRPRRFGKTLAQTMLKCFFEKEFAQDGSVVDKSRYFEGRKIMNAGYEYTKHMGQYPVIFMTLKSAKQPDFDTAYIMLKRSIIGEFSRHAFVRESITSADDRRRFDRILIGEGSMADYADSLALLSRCLEGYYQKRCIILLDEYDVPLENAYFAGFYDQMVGFVRSLFESSLKTNGSLERAVVTGCLRISKESIFTGLNNLEVVSILNNSYGEHFGFLQKEVDEMFDFYGLRDRLEEAKLWYDGYFFGESEVYNPWSTINYVKEHVYGKEKYPKPYWSNTSSNSIVHELIAGADIEVRQELEILLAGGAIEKPVFEDITFADVHASMDNLWNFLFFTGYLQKESLRFNGTQLFVSLRIPNREIAYIYRNFIVEWFRDRTKMNDFSALYVAVLSGDAEVVEDIINEQLMESISYFDYDESFYHGFMVGILKGCKNYLVKSNRESGYGRPDILMKYGSVRGKAVIMEFKIVEEFEKLGEGCEKALAQIVQRRYEAELYREGYRDILKYGICFYRKECMVMLGERAAT